MKKIQEFVQHKHQNLTQFLDHPTKAILQYTNLDPEIPDGKQLIKTYVFSQGFFDIRAKLRHREKGPLTSQADVLALACNVYHGSDVEPQDLVNHSNYLGSLSSRSQRPSGILLQMQSRRPLGTGLPEPSQITSTVSKVLSRTLGFWFFSCS